jgi:hypothetical protein
VTRNFAIPPDTFDRGNGHGSAGRAAPAKGRSRWPFLVVALLAGHVLILAAVVLVATRDPSFAVTPDYYEQAVAWDATQAQKRASEKLGWKLDLLAGDEADRAAGRELSLTLRDASGAAIAGATIEVMCFHHSHATRPQRFTVTTAADGKALATTAIRHPGFWDFRCIARARDQAFTTTITQSINPPVAHAERTASR